MMRFLFYAVVAFLLVWSLGILLLTADLLATSLGWLALLVMWVVAVVSGRLTFVWLRDRGKDSPQPPKWQVGLSTSLVAAVGSSMGVLIWQGVGPSMILGTVSLLLMAFMGGLMFMKSPF